MVNSSRNREFVLVWAVAISLSVTIPHPARSEDDGAKVLGQTRDSGSLPLWSAPGVGALQELGQAARNLERGIFLVGDPTISTGTAWVISKEHRLLVTNAHVADIYFEAGQSMLAIPSGTSQIYSVEKVWYHPGVRRISKRLAGQSIRSMDPGEGGVDPLGPDLALLQLSSAGPELSVEFAPATPTELQELFAQPAAIMGFPGHDTKSWPKLGEKAAATFHEGVISRVTDFEMGTSAPPAELQFLQYTMATWPGFSGSPVFLPSGRVAAVHNCAPPEEGRYHNPEEGKQHIITILHGIRVDCVLEMCAFHHLEDKLPVAFDKSTLLIDRWINPDARTQKAEADMAQARALLSEAYRLAYYTYDYKGAVEKCDAALRIVPTLADAFKIRSSARNNYYVDHGGVDVDLDIRLLSAANADAIKYAQAVPSDPAGIIQVCRTLNNMGRVTGNTENNRKALAILNDALTSENLTNHQRAESHSSRGVALDHLGDDDAALREHNSAVRLAPDKGIFLWNRSYYWEAVGRPDLAAADVAKARQLDAQSSGPLKEDAKPGQTVVLVEWKGQWYRAVVLKTEGEKSLVHYLGYESSWDEWVSKNRIQPAK